jgi:hypothetical protein
VKDESTRPQRSFRAPKGVSDTYQLYFETSLQRRFGDRGNLGSACSQHRVSMSILTFVLLHQKYEYEISGEIHLYVQFQKNKQERGKQRLGVIQGRSNSAIFEYLKPDAQVATQPHPCCCCKWLYRKCIMKIAFMF